MGAGSGWRGQDPTREARREYSERDGRRERGEKERRMREGAVKRVK